MICINAFKALGAPHVDHAFTTRGRHRCIVLGWRNPPFCSSVADGTDEAVMGAVEIWQAHLVEQVV
eukprot:10374623-Prorocentrum_lima.AAC.1